MSAQTTQYRSKGFTLGTPTEKWLGIGCVFLLVLMVSCGGCVALAYSRGTSGATPVADEFFADVKKSDTAHLWASSHPEFRKVTTQAELEALLSRVELAMGPLKSYRQTASNVSTHNGVVTVRFAYKVTFANGPADGQVMISKVGGKYQLLAFSFNSPQLMASPACPSCGAANPSGTKFCANCGASLSGTNALDGSTSATLEAKSSVP